MKLKSVKPKIEIMFINIDHPASYYVRGNTWWKCGKIYFMWSDIREALGGLNPF